MFISPAFIWAEKNEVALLSPTNKWLMLNYRSLLETLTWSKLTFIVFVFKLHQNDLSLKDTCFFKKRAVGKNVGMVTCYNLYKVNSKLLSL